MIATRAQAARVAASTGRLLLLLASNGELAARRSV